MGPPRHPAPRQGDLGYGPFGRKAFHGAMIGCVVLVGVGVAMMLLGDSDVVAAGTSLVALAAVGFGTAGAGLAVERLLQRRPGPRGGRSGHGPPGPPPASADAFRRNGRGSHPPDPSRTHRPR